MKSERIAITDEKHSHPLNLQAPFSVSLAISVFSLIAYLITADGVSVLYE